MPPLAAPRPGRVLQVRGRPLTFSFWPMYKGKRRYSLQSNIFATNPWALMRASVKARCPAYAIDEALASLLQAEQFFRAAAEATLWASKPLLLYYSFMNMAKALALTNRGPSSFDQAQHGMTEQLRAPSHVLVNAFLKAFPSPTAAGKRNIFADFLEATSGVVVQSVVEYDIPYLLPQIVTGHRIWCDVTGKRERFVSIELIEILHAPSAKTMWLRLNLFADDLTRLGVSHRELLDESGLKGQWHEVTPDEDMLSDRRILRFEQTVPLKYAQRPSDKVATLVTSLRGKLWTTVTSVPPYRKYYLYLSPPSERLSLLPQLQSLYSLVYYLSSITRYRPQQFDTIIEGRFGEQIQEILTNQPNQFLYLMASEFAQRDVTRAAIV